MTHFVKCLTCKVEKPCSIYTGDCDDCRAAVYSREAYEDDGFEMRVHDVLFPSATSVIKPPPPAARYCGTCTRCKGRPGSRRDLPFTATGTTLTGCVCDPCWQEVVA